MGHDDHHATFSAKALYTTPPWDIVQSLGLDAIIKAVWHSCLPTSWKKDAALAPSVVLPVGEAICWKQCCSSTFWQSWFNLPVQTQLEGGQIQQLGEGRWHNILCRQGPMRSQDCRSDQERALCCSDSALCLTGFSQCGLLKFWSKAHLQNIAGEAQQYRPTCILWLYRLPIPGKNSSYQICQQLYTCCFQVSA